MDSPFGRDAATSRQQRPEQKGPTSMIVPSRRISGVIGISIISLVIAATPSASASTQAIAPTSTILVDASPPVTNSAYGEAQRDLESAISNR